MAKNPQVTLPPLVSEQIGSKGGRVTWSSPDALLSSCFFSILDSSSDLFGKLISVFFSTFLGTKKNILVPFGI